MISNWLNWWPSKREKNITEDLLVMFKNVIIIVTLVLAYAWVSEDDYQYQIMRAEHGTR